jgi:hypothetical protein
MSVDVVHIGPQKSATSWIHSCLVDHPQICTPYNRAIHYYDIHYHRGSEWYKQQFPQKKNVSHTMTLDATYSYLRSPVSASRMFGENRNMKIIVCLRNPLQRAFSHFWHEYKKNTLTYHFSDVLHNYDLFASWIETGFYDVHLSRFFELFDTQNILVQKYDDLEDSPVSFYSTICRFLSVDSSHSPHNLTRIINPAGMKRNGWFPIKIIRKHLSQLFSPSKKHPGTKEKQRYFCSLPPQLIKDINSIFMPHIRACEKMTSLDLSNWYTP